MYPNSNSNCQLSEFELLSVYCSWAKIGLEENGHILFIHTLFILKLILYLNLSLLVVTFVVCW